MLNVRAVEFRARGEEVGEGEAATAGDGGGAVLGEEDDEESTPASKKAAALKEARPIEPENTSLEGLCMKFQFNKCHRGR